MDGATFLRESYRILKPGGVLRVTTPDLEKYLEAYVNRKSSSFLQVGAQGGGDRGACGRIVSCGIATALYDRDDGGAGASGSHGGCGYRRWCRSVAFAARVCRHPNSAPG